MVNNVKANVPPRIEKWIMESQDVDYELVHEPGKDETHPAGFLFRHPLIEKDGNTEKITRWNTNAEHAVLLSE